MNEMRLPDYDISCKEAKKIIMASSTSMEIVEYSYTLGYNRGINNGGTVKVPLYNLNMISDERWNELAKRNRNERQADEYDE